MQMMLRATSTGSLNEIFATSMNLSMMDSYTAAPDTTAGWTRRTTVPNFQSNERPLMGKGSAMALLARGKNALLGSRGATEETYKASRYARDFRIDEQDIIDDNRSVLMDTPQDLGEGAAQVVPDLVYSILFANAVLGADSVALFNSATHANTATSAGLAATTLQTGIQAIMTQAQDGRSLNLRAGTLIVPAALLHTARQLLNSAELIATDMSATANLVQGSSNPIRADNLSLVSDARLDNGVTDPASGTAHAADSNDWFLAAANTRNTIEVGFVAATGQAPVTRSYILTEGAWGIGWDIKLDVGAKALDYRGLYRGQG
jgi:hypothetical protein